MQGTPWGTVLIVGFCAGVGGAFLFTHWATVRTLVAPYWRRVRLHVPGRLQRRSAPVSAPRPARREADDEIVVLIPDGRPWPLGPALHLLELAMRWQVAHGANLPLRARQGEGAYVWRPPLPVRNSDQGAVEAEQK
jgi:hypothetical protein